MSDEKIQWMTIRTYLKRHETNSKQIIVEDEPCKAINVNEVGQALKKSAARRASPHALPTTGTRKRSQKSACSSSPQVILSLNNNTPKKHQKIVFAVHFALLGSPVHMGSGGENHGRECQ